MHCKICPLLWSAIHRFWYDKWGKLRWQRQSRYFFCISKSFMKTQYNIANTFKLKLSCNEEWHLFVPWHLKQVNKHCRNKLDIRWPFSSAIKDSKFFWLHSMNYAHFVLDLFKGITFWISFNDKMITI